MALISLQELPADGAISEITFSAASTSDLFQNNGRVLYLINNGSGGSVNASFTPTQDSGDLITDSATAKAIGAGEIGIFGTFSLGKFNNTSGQVAVTLSSATSVTVAAIQLPRNG